MIEHPLPRTDETIRLMAEKGTESDPTIFPYMKIFEWFGGYYGSTSWRFTFTEQSAMEMFRKLKRAGITMGVGIDMPSDATWPEPHIQQLRYFVQGGYTIPEALVAATKSSAEILDMDDKLGTIEPGKLADRIVIDGRPDEDLDELANVDIVVRDGYIVVKDGRIFVPRRLPIDREQ